MVSLHYSVYSECLSASNRVLALGTVSLCSLLSSTVCSMPVSTSQYTTCQHSVSTSQWTIFLFCVIVYTDNSYSFPKSVSTSHSSDCLFRATGSTAVFYSMPSVCHYLTDYHFLVVSQCPQLSSMIRPMFVRTSHITAPWFCVIMPTAVQYQLVYHNLLSVVAESVRPLLSSLDCLMSVSMSHLTVRWFCVTKSTAFI